MAQFIFDVHMVCEVEADIESEAFESLQGDGYEPFATDIRIERRSK